MQCGHRHLPGVTPPRGPQPGDAPGHPDPRGGLGSPTGPHARFGAVPAPQCHPGSVPTSPRVRTGGLQHPWGHWGDRPPPPWRGFEGPPGWALSLITIPGSALGDAALSPCPPRGGAGVRRGDPTAGMWVLIRAGRGRHRAPGDTGDTGCRGGNSGLRGTSNSPGDIGVWGTPGSRGHRALGQSHRRLSVTAGTWPRPCPFIPRAPPPPHSQPLLGPSPALSPPRRGGTARCPRPQPLTQQLLCQLWGHVEDTVGTRWACPCLAPRTSGCGHTHPDVHVGTRMPQYVHGQMCMSATRCVCAKHAREHICAPRCAL